MTMYFEQAGLDLGADIIWTSSIRLLARLVDKLPRMAASDYVVGADVTGWFQSAYGVIDHWIPVELMVMCMVACLSMEAGILTMRFISWVFNKVRGSG